MVKRKEKLASLHKAGLPEHITISYLLNDLDEVEYVELFKFLRPYDIPVESIIEGDFLPEKVDLYVFRSLISKEDGLFLMEHRHHIELMDRFKDLKLKEVKKEVKYIKWLLIDLGFNDHPESVKKVVQGANPKTVASFDGIIKSDEIRKSLDSSHDNIERLSDKENKDNEETENEDPHEGRFIPK